LRSSLSRTSTTYTVPIKLTLRGDGSPQRPTTFSPYLPFCRICHDTDVDSCGPLIAPCLCDGSLKHVHQTCLQHWIDISQLKRCELCHFEFEIRKCPKPNAKQSCCALSRRQLYLFSVFEPTTLLLAALAIWWFVFTFSHSTASMPPAPMSPALYVAAIVVAFTFFHFVGLFVCWIVYFCKYEKERRQIEYVDMVQEPSRQRIATASLCGFSPSTSEPFQWVMSRGTLNTPSCRICYDSNESTNDREVEPRGRLIAPCLCTGSLKYVHQWCIQRWIELSRSRRCELCHFKFCMRKQAKKNKEVAMQNSKSYTFEIIAIFLTGWSSVVVLTRDPAEILLSLFLSGLVGLIIGGFIKFFTHRPAVSSEAEGASSRVEYVYVVQEPSKRRVARLRRAANV
uniref:RING-CH-type domain-containing protein n=1 Tax=Taenia asiatica TaxID=60517 RepID=A0A0R3VWQ0_TAEAS